MFPKLPKQAASLAKPITSIGGLLGYGSVKDDHALPKQHSNIMPASGSILKAKKTLSDANVSY